MNYIVFNTSREVAEANGRWIYARALAPEFDRKQGTPVNPQITSAWDMGKETLDGRIACQVPTMWKDDFVADVGIEIILTEEDFPVVNGEA